MARAGLILVSRTMLVATSRAGALGTFSHRVYTTDSVYDILSFRLGVVSFETLGVCRRRPHHGLGRLLEWALRHLHSRG